MKKFKTVIIIAILVAMCVLYYYYISANNKTKTTSTNSKTSEITKVIEKDLDKSYPSKIGRASCRERG